MHLSMPKKVFEENEESFCQTHFIISEKSRFLFFTFFLFFSAEFYQKAHGVQRAVVWCGMGWMGCRAEARRGWPYRPVRVPAGPRRTSATTGSRSRPGSASGGASSAGSCCWPTASWPWLCRTGPTHMGTQCANPGKWSVLFETQSLLCGVPSWCTLFQTLVANTPKSAVSRLQPMDPPTRVSGVLHLLRRRSSE